MRGYQVMGFKYNIFSSGLKIALRAFYFINVYMTWYYYKKRSQRHLLTGGCELLINYSIDHPTQLCHSSPLGGTDTDKQNNSARLACVCLSLSRLAAINGTKGGVIYSPMTVWPGVCWKFSWKREKETSKGKPIWMSLLFPSLVVNKPHDRKLIGSSINISKNPDFRLFPFQKGWES